MVFLQEITDIREKLSFAWSCRSCRLLWESFAHDLHYDEYTYRYDDEVDDRLDECTILHSRTTYDVLETLEVYTAREDSYERHDDITDYR